MTRLFGRSAVVAVLGLLVLGLASGLASCSDSTTGASSGAGGTSSASSADRSSPRCLAVLSTADGSPSVDDLLNELPRVRLGIAATARNTALAFYAGDTPDVSIDKPPLAPALASADLDKVEA